MNKKNITTIFGFIIIMLLSILPLRSSHSYFIHQEQQNTTTSVAKVQCSITPSTSIQNLYEGQPNQQLNFTIHNDSNISTYIRALPVVTWEDFVPNNETCTIINENWQLGSDDFFYYLYPVKPNESLDVTVSIEFGLYDTNVNKEYTVQLFVENVQKNNLAYLDAFPLAPPLKDNDLIR